MDCNREPTITETTASKPDAAWPAVIASEAPGDRKYEQTYAKMKTKWLKIGSLEGSGRPLAAEPASGAPPEASWGGSGAPRGGQKNAWLSI